MLKRVSPSFNSLQTGKTFRTQCLFPIYTGYQSFNSLQTGKTFRTLKIYFTIAIYWIVSIPFKRERLSEPGQKGDPLCQSLRFNSLQTGKTFRTNTDRNVVPREHLHGFNSLQTGKTFRTDIRNIRQLYTANVSIPFKRERLSELFTNTIKMERPIF